MTLHQAHDIQHKELISPRTENVRLKKQVLNLFRYVI